MAKHWAQKSTATASGFVLGFFTSYVAVNIALQLILGFPG